MKALDECFLIVVFTHVAAQSPWFCQFLCLIWTEKHGSERVKGDMEWKNMSSIIRFYWSNEGVLVFEYGAVYIICSCWWRIWKGRECLYVVQIQKPNFLPNQGTVFCGAHVWLFILKCPSPSTFFTPICQMGDEFGGPLNTAPLNSEDFRPWLSPERTSCGGQRSNELERSRTARLWSKRL